ncbi:hypothetical protein AJ80_02815 [Polytolypa hystricis UAMH7299]|uniref:Major facilitator superfamily (MFS) profile domain-containing protein n=1 Tax=Polytolypa hystricis (strain UAMH7299) TaxID=1447883 RepID=A0A2B7YQA6_POLH7|nr:hypothetical protein AJ80_02815 [Polytolypa hystricis UAMH7299]
MDSNNSLKKPTAEEAAGYNRTIQSMRHGDSVLAVIGSERVKVTEADNKWICRKTDKVILAILVWVYFLQILDKSVLGYAAIFGLQEDTHLTGNEYSLVGSIAAMAQLAWQPFSMVLIVKVPHRILMPSLVLGWGIAQASMASCNTYAGLLATRFFLGLFEAGCLPLFSIITSQWYRRAEQPVRVAAWYGTNGLATMAASSLSFGLGHIQSDKLESWRIIFLVVGMITVVSAPLVYWKLPNDIPSAHFLTAHERKQAIERLRFNQTGTGSRAFRWRQVGEAFLGLETYLWISMSLLLNVGASVTNIFGPLILNGLGYDKYITSLLNIPFGAVQFMIILAASYAAQKVRLKSAVLVVLALPVIAGLAMLYALQQTQGGNQAPRLAAYYLLAFLFGGNPLLVAWIVGNTAGTTKKSFVMSLYNAGSSAGNIIGPLLFAQQDAPGYRPGLRAVLGIFSTLVVVVGIQVCNLMVLNWQHSERRLEEGKKKDFKDISMTAKFSDSVSTENTEGEAEAEAEAGGAPPKRLGENAFSDITDRKNSEFVYIY